MIKTDRQYQVSRAKLQQFREALHAFETGEGQANEMDQIRAAGFRTMVVELERELADYEHLKEGRLPKSSQRPFEDLPDILVEQRIAAGLTQRELAERLGMKEQQIQRYEATDYNGASLARVLDVVEAMPEFRVSLVVEPDAAVQSVRPVAVAPHAVQPVQHHVPVVVDAALTTITTASAGMISPVATPVRDSAVVPVPAGYLVYFGNQGRLHSDLAERGIYFIDSNAISVGPTLEEVSGMWSCLAFDTVMQRRHTLIDACRLVGSPLTKQIRGSSLQQVSRQAQPA
jgi:ribosome-binding protein aMBF1 (putative translation factor)